MKTQKIDPFGAIKELLQSKISGISFSLLHGDLVITGNASVYQNVRSLMSKQGIDLLIVRNPKNHMIENIRISAIDIKKKGIEFLKPKLVVEKKSVVVKIPKPKAPKIKKIKTPKPKKEKILKPKKITKVPKVIKVAKVAKVKIKTPKVEPIKNIEGLPSLRSECKNRSEEVQLISKTLGKYDFFCKGYKLPASWTSKDGKIIHYRCKNQYVKELQKILGKVGYNKSYLKVASVNESRTTIEVSLKHGYVVESLSKVEFTYDEKLDILARASMEDLKKALFAKPMTILKTFRIECSKEFSRRMIQPTEVRFCRGRLNQKEIKMLMKFSSAFLIKEILSRSDTSINRLLFEVRKRMNNDASP